MNGEGVFDPNGGTVFFPATGYRSTGGRLSSYGTDGGYWSVIPVNARLGRSILFNKDRILLANNQDRYTAHSIRPILEQ